MSGDAEIITQDEIEELLRQAQAAARGVAAPASAVAAASSGEPAMSQMGQDDIEAMLKTAATAPPPAAAAAPANVGQDEIEAMLRGHATAKAPATAASASAVKTPPPSPPPVAPPKSAAAPARNITDDISYLLSQAEEALASVDQPVAKDLAGLAPFEFRDFGGSPASTEKATLELLREVELDVKIELGRTHMAVEEVLRLRKGAVVPLDKLAGDPVDIYVNGRLVARGEVLVLNDNFCVRVAELLAGEEAKAA